MPADVTVTVDGVPDVIRALGQIQPELRKAATARLKTAAEPVASAARGLIPDRPLSGWRPGGRTGWQASRVRRSVTIKFRSSARRWERSEDTFVLLRLNMGSAAGSIFDMAGRRSAGATASGQAMIAALNRKHGTASRAMWRAAESQLSTVQAGVIAAIDDVAATLNRELDGR